MAKVELITRRVQVGIGVSRKVLQVRPAATINNGPVTIIGSAAGAFTQPTPLLVWNVVHNLGRFPVVMLKTLGTTVVEGEINHVSLNEFTVTFNTPLAGQAIYT